MPTEREFFASTRYKVLAAAGTVFFGLACILMGWLWTLGEIPGLFAVLSGLFSLMFGIRFLVVQRNPVVVIDGPIVGIVGWAGVRRNIDLRMAMDIAIGSDGIVVKQGRAGAAIVASAVGKCDFEELVDLFQASQFTKSIDA